MFLYHSLNNIQITCIIIIIINSLLILFLLAILNSKKSCKVYLVNHATFKPKKSQQMTRQKSISMIKPLGPNFTEDTVKLIKKLIMVSGFCDTTYAPEGFLSNPPDFTLSSARREGEDAIFTTVKAVLEKTGVKASEIGVLVVNCNTFNPVPSLTSMIVNEFKLRDDIKSFNLSGMGCSAGIAAIGLANQLLKVHKNTYAMIVTTEILTQAFYVGNEPNKQPMNCLFRVGGSAVLLSNNPSDEHISKYQLIHNVLTNTSSSNSSYNCIQLEEDLLGLRGFHLTKDLVVEARNAIKANIITLGHLILPISEKFTFSLNYLMKRVIRISGKNLETHIPNFGRVIDHFVCHVGVKFVIDTLEKIVKLDVESARMTLHRFGNTSGSSVWYGLAYIEAKGKVIKGNRIWQMAFGSGFKCNSIIWKALKNVGREEDNPWNEDIDLYPIEINFEPFSMKQGVGRLYISM